MNRPEQSGRVVLIHLFTLCTLAISQPLFDLLGANPQFFLIRDAGLLELGAFLVFTWALPATVLFFLWRIASRLNRNLGRGTFICSVFLLLLLTALQVCNSLLSATDSTVIIAALAAAGLLTTFYCRSILIRSLLSYMAIIVAVAPALFLFTFYQGVYGGTKVATAPPTATNPAPVVMIIFDELPLSILLEETGGIDAGRFPNFAQLQETATWYRNASTVSDKTALAVPALLTGTLIDIDELAKVPSPTTANYPRNLFSLLQKTHDIRAEERISRLCPESVCQRTKDNSGADIARLPVLLEDVLVVYLHILLPTGMRSDLPPLHQNWGGFRLLKKPFLNIDDYLFKQNTVTLFAQSLQRQQGLHLHFLHLMLPHQPWRFYPSGTAYSRMGGGDMLGIDWEAWHHTWHENKRTLMVAFQRQLMQVAYADKVLGQILQALEHSGRAKDTLLIVTSDHGANISAGGQLRWAYPENLREIMAVPLFIRYPQQTEPDLNLENVQLTDVLPTIDELMGINSGWDFAGRSLLHKTSNQRKELSSPMGKPRGEQKQSIELEPGELLVNSHPLREFLYREIDGRPFQLASYSPLVGSTTAQHPIESTGQVAYIRDLSALEDVRPRSRFIPGLIRTRLPQGWLQREQQFAIALNGVIEATATVDTDYGLLFDTVLPQKSFKKGRNKLNIYLIKDTPAGTPQLRSLELREDED